MPRTPRVRGVLLTLLLAAGCAPARVDLSSLEAQGEAGAMAVEMIEAHGGVDAFRHLVDVEHRVEVELLDASGALRTSVSELHRFQTAPPHRYVLRRSGPRVSEMGLGEDGVWVRVDGALQERAALSEMALNELGTQVVISRAPFSLADPGVELSLMPEVTDEKDGGVLRRLAVEVPVGPAGEMRRFVFFQRRETGRLERILYEAPDLDPVRPLRLARATESRSIGQGSLPVRWEVQAANASGQPGGVTEMIWTATDTRSGNGFTPELYRAR